MAQFRILPDLEKGGQKHVVALQAGAAAHRETEKREEAKILAAKVGEASNTYS